MFSNQAIIADHLAHNRSIFLFYKTLIIFQIGASPRERDVFLFTIGDHCLVDAPHHHYPYQSRESERGKAFALVGWPPARFPDSGTGREDIPSTPVATSVSVSVYR